MSEESPMADANAEYQRLVDEGVRLAKQDEESLERGHIIREVRAIRIALSALWSTNGKALQDLAALKAKYIGNFGSQEAERHRLYHAAFGSSPIGTTDAFDFESEEEGKEDWSVLVKMRELAGKYGIATEAL